MGRANLSFSAGTCYPLMNLPSQPYLGTYRKYYLPISPPFHPQPAISTYSKETSPHQEAARASTNEFYFEYLETRICPRKALYLLSIHRSTYKRGDNKLPPRKRIPTHPKSSLSNPTSTLPLHISRNFH